MDLAHKAIYEEGKAVLVEGYMDVVAAHDKGIRNVVASLGTSFTPEQARLLQRQADELVLSYDMDGAGRQATLRAMEIVRGMGLRIRVVSLPQGKDPDEYINSAGPENLKKPLPTRPTLWTICSRQRCANTTERRWKENPLLRPWFFPS